MVHPKIGTRTLDQRATGRAPLLGMQKAMPSSGETMSFQVLMTLDACLHLVL